MTAAPPRDSTGERAYYCRCGGFLCRSAQGRGVVRDVYCRRCGRRSDVYLGGVRAGERKDEQGGMDGRDDRLA